MLDFEVIHQFQEQALAAPPIHKTSKATSAPRTNKTVSFLSGLLVLGLIVVLCYRYFSDPFDDGHVVCGND